MAIARRERFIPVETALSPGFLTPLRRIPEPAFPFDSPRSRWYFNGRNALWHGLGALGLRPGDEVLVPSYNHGVEVSTIIARGLSIRFFRVERDLSIDLAGLRSRLTPRTKALLVIHYFGFPQPLDGLLDICRDRGIALIEDCAQALFSRDGETPLGSTGSFAIYSVFKTLPVPHGGMLVINDAALPLPGPASPPGLASSVSLLPGRVLDGVQMWSPEVARVARSGVAAVSRAFLSGWMSDRMHVGIEQLDPLTVDVGASRVARGIARRCDAEAVVSARRRNYEALFDLVPPARRVAGPLTAGACPLFFPLRAGDRAAERAALATRGIQTIPAWALAHPSIPRGEFPEAEDLRAHVMEIPIHQSLSLEDIEYVAEAIAALPRLER